MSDLVLTSREGPLAIVTINRPQALNALNEAALEAMAATFAELAADDGCRVIIVTGAGDRAFIAGADIAAMAAMTADDARRFMQLGQRVCNRIESAPQVVIGAINGYALGGGCEVALACDLRIAADRAKLGLPEVTLGIIPAWGGTQRLPRIVGIGLAKQLIYTGQQIDAAEAYRIGLVNQVVSAAELMPAARAAADAILRNGPLAVRAAKDVLETTQDADLPRGLMAELEAEVRLFATADRLEGMTAFLERRPPRYQGA
ncbi:MAG: enoyl-CoA hydratase-related protein [Chloroflexota bacterium]|nr:enoyl-CoA hydratase-related protein [Dehalococcoidia bacterium]MDW8255317.1 enoyl-CoA hydratase-related protein [Chloroflexota bacterium]